MGRQANSLKNRLATGISKLGGRVLNYVTPGQVGSPDLIVFMPRGDVFFVETKTTDRLTDKQKREHERLRALGCMVFVARGAREIDQVINKIELLWNIKNC